MEKKFNNLTLVVQINADGLVVPADCRVGVSDAVTSITAFNRSYSLCGCSDFYELFKRVLRMLNDVEKYNARRSISVECLINRQQHLQDDALNDYQIMHAVLCAVFGFSLIYPDTPITTLNLIVGNRCERLVCELLQTENYKDFHDVHGGHNMIGYIRTIYGIPKGHK